MRKKLRFLVNKKLLRVTTNHLYNCRMWQITDRVTTTTINPLCYIDGVDIQTSRCTVTATVLNKLRHIVNSLKTRTISLSAAKLKDMIGTDKSRGKIRLVLKELEDKGFVKSRLVGRECEYTINSDKINYINSSDIVKADAKALAAIFGDYRRYLTVTSKSSELWEEQFAAILRNGRTAEAIKHIIAYLVHSEDDTITKPAEIEEVYHILYALAYSKLSSSKAKRALWKAKNQEPLKRKATDIFSILPNRELLALPYKPPKLDPAMVLSNEAKWELIEKWLKKNIRLLLYLFPYQNYGVNIDFDDYKSQALIFGVELINRRGMVLSDKFFTSKVLYELKTYMDSLRPKNRSNKKYKKLEAALLEAEASGIYNVEELKSMKEQLEDLNKKLVTTTFSDLEYTLSGEKFDFLEKYVTSKEEIESKYSDKLRTDILSRLDEIKETCPYLHQIVCHAHGLDCEQLSYRELAKKYDTPYSTIYGHVQHVLKCLKEGKTIKQNKIMKRINNRLAGYPPP